LPPTFGNGAATVPLVPGAGWLLGFAGQRATMRFSILGSVEVWAGDRRLALGGPRQLGLLSFLVLHRNRAVSRDWLMDALWGEDAGRGDKRLQMAIARLRKELEPPGGAGERRLRTVSGGYLLAVDSGELDAEVFAAGVSDGRAALAAGDPGLASGLLGEALGLWRGPPLAEVAFAEFAQADIRQLEELRLEALESRVEADLELGRHLQLIGELEALRVQHPARERVAGQLMRALYRSGRQSEALGVYARLRTELLDQVGLEPGPDLSALQAQILEQAPALDLDRGGNASRAATPARVGSRAPEGTIALFFAEIEGPTPPGTEPGVSWPMVLKDHHALLSAAVADAGGFVDSTEGDAFLATFTDARAAAQAAVVAMRSLHSHPWPGAVGELRVRMGLHVGQVQRTETGYAGLELQRAARVAAAAHGGQLLLTAAARELVGDELITESVGVHRLKDFPTAMMLFCAVIDGRGAAGFPPPRTESVRPTNLPAGRPELVGRDGELRRVVDAVASGGDRLVTLTGRGGAGKTSLALVAGIELLDRHPGGVWWVDLTTVGSPDEVPLAIAAVVGAERASQGSVEVALEARLRHSGATLLVLDNMEHVLTGAGALCGLLDRLPDLRLLVSSRLPLRVDPERVIALDGLDERSALELIARSVGRRGLQPPLADADAGALRAIVELLDGLPLALELAAARLSVLTAVQLRDRLRESIDVLGDARGGRPARQRSLRAALESTLSLLDPGPQVLFVRMGAFVGPVELEELERVVSDDGMSVLEALAELVDAALVQRVETGDGTMKFGLAEALRQIASEQLDRTPDGAYWRHAHAQRQYELAWACRATWVDRRTWVAAHAAVREVAAALRWARANHDPLEQPLAAAYASLLLVRGRVREGGAITERLIASPPADAEVRWLAFLAQSSYLEAIGRFEDALRFADEAYSLAPDAKTRSYALVRRGNINVFGGHTAEGVKDHAEASALARELHDPAFLAGALAFEAQALTVARLPDEAAARLAEARTAGAPVDAAILYYVNTFVGDLCILDGRPAEALEPYARSLERSLADGNLIQIQWDLFSVADALAALGHDSDSLEIAGMAESHKAEIGALEESLFVEHLEALEQRLGPTRTAEFKERGRAADVADRVARACQLARSHPPTRPVAHD
jgi:predicted ATPase/DNA-binding SARP family transcriptional activator